MHAIFDSFSVPLTGIIVSTKAVLSEVSSDQNHAVGMAVITTSYGAGLVIGPAVSGVIADPIGQYNLTINSEYIRHLPQCSVGLNIPILFYFHGDNAIRTFLTVFPYSLPCIVSGLLFAVSSVAVMIWLPRTFSKKRLVCHLC